jgi:hypothetical protein
VQEIMRFVDGGGRESFPFFLVDPTGWTGFELETIRPILRRDPGEVLVNFMTSFVRRFIKWADPTNQAGFDRTFGPYRPKAEDLVGRAEEDFDDVLVGAYSRLMEDVGKFEHVCNSIVLDPDKDSTHFNLIYGTRDVKGVEVFKEAERRAMEHHEETRAELRSAHEEQKAGPSLFGTEGFASRHYDQLRERYLATARRSVIDRLNAAKSLRYDDAFAAASAYPLVWEKDLKEWISNWRDQSVVEVVGLKPGRRVPQLREGHMLRVLKVTN